MIPTLLVLGLLVGRWSVVPLAAVGWALLLMVEGVGSGAGFAVSAGALGAANTFVGVAVRRALSSGVRSLSSRCRR